MENPVEFSEFYKLLSLIKEGDDTKYESLNTILQNYKEGSLSESFLHELGQNFLIIGVEELFKYSNSSDLNFIGKLTKEEWKALANKNEEELPYYLANKMISHAKESQYLDILSKKWETPKRQIRKHIVPMARYITEGIIDVLQ